MVLFSKRLIDFLYCITVILPIMFFKEENNVYLPFMFLKQALNSDDLHTTLLWSPTIKLFRFLKINT